MTHCLFRFWLLCILLQLPLSAEFRTFTSDFGDTVEAELIELKESGTIVRLKLRSGREIDAMLTAFSQADQKFMRQWWADELAKKQLLTAESRLTISAKMNPRSKNSGYDSWYSASDKTKAYFPEVIIKSDDLETLRGNSVRVVVIAKDLRDSDQKLIVSAKTIEEVDFPRRGEVILESDPFRLRTYEYNSTYGSDYAAGYEYEGYVVVIKNSAGEITHMRSGKTKFLTNMDVIYECEAGEIYDDSLDKNLNMSPNSYYVR